MCERETQVVVLEQFGIRGAEMTAFSASAIMLESLWDQVHRQNILGLILQLEVSPKLMHFLFFSICEVKWLIKLETETKCNMTLCLLHLSMLKVLTL